METRFRTSDEITIHCYEGNFFVKVREYEELLKEFEELKAKNEEYEKLIRSAEC